MLRIDNLSKTYKNGVKALDDLSLNIGVGMFGLLGPNGAGKSSLMRTIATLQQADSGSISYKGQDILEDKMTFRSILGYLPQEFGVYAKDSAEQLLDYFAVLKGITSKKDRRLVIDEVLQLTNLFADRKKRVSTYSGGMRQRFGIAQLLLNNPEVIIVDEPTAGLDPAERARFLNVLREIGNRNIVIFSTHLVDDVKELCTDMAIIDKGQMKSNSSPAESLKTLQGKIWTREVLNDEMLELKGKYNVLSNQYDEHGSMKIRIHSITPLGDGFVQSDPTLEDYYFLTLSK